MTTRILDLKPHEVGGQSNWTVGANRHTNPTLRTTNQVDRPLANLVAESVDE
jgi:uncharacterized membrane-anchored protein